MSALTDQIERRLANDAGLYIAVEDEGDRMVLSGMVDNDDLRQAAYDIVLEMAPGRRIDDNLDVMDALAAEIGGADVAPVAENGSVAIATPDLSDEAALEPGDFQRGGQETDPLAPLGASYEKIGPDLAPEGGEVYVPPMDPDLPPPDALANLELTSMDSDEVARSVSDGRLSDDAIGVAVARELAEDAATSDLDVAVGVQNGTVRLRGLVATLDDAENAEAVASRVPGVVDVHEEIDVQDLGGR